MSKKALQLAAAFSIFAIAVMTLLAPGILDQVYAAVTIYSTTRGVEREISHWASGVPSRGINNMRWQTGTIVFDSSYPTGGETFDLSGTFDNKVLFCIIAPQSGFNFEYVHATASAAAAGKIYAYADSTGLEVANTTDMQTVVTEYFAIGY